MKNCLLVIMAFLALSGNLSAQEMKSKSSSVSKKILYYSFTGAADQNEFESLKKKILLIEGVKEIKHEFKAEKNAGQLRIVYEEKTRTKESDKDFDITAVKKLLLSHHLVPGDVKTEDFE